MSGASKEGPFKLMVDPRNDQYDPDDDRWLAQVALLHQALDSSVDVVRDQRPTPGAKGAVDQLIIALGSAGAFQAAVDCFRAWLGRDRDRRIDIRWNSGGAERSVTLTGEGVDMETIRDLAKAAASQAGGPSWPADTGHS
jgi:hypothetical protein